MSYLKYIRQAWKTPQESMPEQWRARLLEWRKEPSSVRIERPTRIDRARAVGYRAKKGFVLVRQRVPRGGRMREKPAGGRRSKNTRRQFILNISYQQVAEQRAGKNFPNCEVLNSYWVAKDGLFYWYEVILVDRDSPDVLSDKRLSWIANEKGRVHRGLTSAAKKSRGLTRKGMGAEKVRR
jgi:large subunit ribosomal protein L15e